MLRKLIIIAAFVPFAAASAGGVADTHEEVWQPNGKTVKLFRLKDRPACAPVVQHHQAGKTLHMRAPEQRTCATELAQADRAERKD